MMNVKSVIIGLFLSIFLSNLAAANICPTVPVEQNGCTTEYDGVEFRYFPEVAAFAHVFKKSCNTHDVCYQTLGASKASCDSQFKRDMKKQCDDKYNKYLRPGENSLCTTAANAGYRAVDRLGDEFYENGQLYIEAKGRELAQRVGNNECGTTPYYSGIYSGVLLDTLENAFLQQLGRQPSAFEEFFSCIFTTVKNHCHNGRIWSIAM